ncbi:MAG: copper chaperone PCu(A)C [Gammaproteobacteria bacterium]|nr:copper chaperone PCu(A)C [Gammaproteobacteria bacterium]MDH3448929.1 copper chaperone PCu(A)C [Gammaproteobacteria bacterium]
MQRPLLALLMIIPLAALADLEISDAWIKNLPASVPVRAGYLTLRNLTKKSVTIVGAISPGFASVEIHRSVSQDGMARMEAVPKLQIEGGTTVRLEPGGLHLMMMQPAQPTSPGELYRITFEYADGSRQSLQMEVRK